MKVRDPNTVLPGIRGNRSEGFSLLEVILVVFIISLVVSLTAVFSVEAYQISRDKKMAMQLLQAVSDLRSTSIYEMKASRIFCRDDQLVLDLSGREFKTFSFEEPDYCTLKNDIRFNRYGLTAGGEIRVSLSRQYRIMVDGIQGRIRLEEL